MAGSWGWRVSSRELAVNKRKDNVRKFAHLTHLYDRHSDLYGESLVLIDESSQRHLS